MSSSTSTSDSTSTSTSSVPNPSMGILWFFVLTTIYFIIKYVMGAKGYMLYFVIYLFLLIGGEFFINFSLAKAMCGSAQLGPALFITFIPWIIIFGLLNVALFLFPGWKSPFSNTFGYGVTRLFGINDLLNKILKPQNTNSKDPNSVALEHIYSDRSLLINEINPEKFDDFWKGMSSLFTSNAGDFKEKLHDLVRLKDIVAEYIWYMLTGVLVTSVGYNYIVNSGCSQSVKEMQKRHKEYEENEKNKSVDQATAKPKRIYASDE